MDQNEPSSTSIPVGWKVMSITCLYRYIIGTRSHRGDYCPYLDIIFCLAIDSRIIFHILHRPRGPMDKASDFESEDCGFDPHRGQFSECIKCLPERSIYGVVTGGLDPSSIVGSVVEFSPATRETGVRFPDNAGFSNTYVNNAIWLLKFDSLLTTRIVGSVVEFSPATRETGVRFPDNADLFCWQYSYPKILARPTLRVGFEPTREDPI